MNIQEYRFLKSELTQITHMLEILPKEEVIDRLSLETRKNDIEDELSTYPPAVREPAKARLTFRGKPIFGSSGMLADFSAKALEKFSDAVTALASNLAGNKLGERGGITDQRMYQLVVTGIALGSFGFELEEYQEQLEAISLENDHSIMEQAIEKTRILFEASLSTDDDLMNIIADFDPRVVSEMHEFLTTLADNEAYCTLETGDKQFIFKDKDQVKRSAKRIDPKNITEGNETLTGQFLGVLPNSRTFEFRIGATAEVVKGKVGKEIENAEVINQYLHTPISILVHTKRTGISKPSYTLIEMQC